MKPAIWIDVHCDICDYTVGQYYRNAKSISKLKAATKNWIYSPEYDGNICPECQKKIFDNLADE